MTKKINYIIGFLISISLIILGILIWFIIPSNVIFTIFILGSLSLTINLHFYIRDLLKEKGFDRNILTEVEKLQVNYHHKISEVLTCVSCFPLIFAFSILSLIGLSIFLTISLLILSLLILYVIIDTKIWVWQYKSIMKRRDKEQYDKEQKKKLKLLSC